MKKDRNSFFSQYGYSAYNQQPNYYPNMNNMQAGYNINSGINTENDIDSRLSRIEREINRLDARITKLESTLSTNTSTTNTDYNFANSMYMV